MPAGKLMSPLVCPICSRAVLRGCSCLPFCSQRCRKIDLARWVDERYRIPVSRQARIDMECHSVDGCFPDLSDLEAGMENAPPE
jgi:uncharacterized protein